MARYAIGDLPRGWHLERTEGEAAGEEDALFAAVAGAAQQLSAAPDTDRRTEALRDLRAIAEAHLVPDARAPAEGLKALALWQQGNRGPAPACPDAERFEGAFFAVWKKRGEGPWDVSIAARPGVEPPEAMARLYVEIIDTLSVLRILYPHPDDHPARRGRGGRVGRWWRRVRGQPTDPRDRVARKFVQYFDRVFGLAAAGLAQGQVALAELALKGLQREIVDREGGEVKNAYV
ncbi:MAG: hypothetical protein AB7P02_23635, partial [Alphaproteobacteria bacterium]